MKTPISENMWKGERCFIIGGGPSLKGFDWSLLDGEKVIATNRGYQYCNPDIILGCDRRFFQAIQDLEFGIGVSFRQYRILNLGQSESANLRKVLRQKYGCIQIYTRTNCQTSPILST
jgi:hypothetical protein